MAPQDGTRLLADEFFLLAHDDATGKSRLHPTVSGIGLAGALLGEQILFGRVDVREGWIVVVDRYDLPDALAQAVLDRLAAQQQPQTVRTWLRSLAETAHDDVAMRLAADGVVTRAKSRWPVRGERWVPADMSRAAWPAARLRMLLAKSESMTTPDVALAGLAVACGLGAQLLWDTPPEARQYLDYLGFTLAEPLRELTRHTETAVGDAVLSRRV